MEREGYCNMMMMMVALAVTLGLSFHVVPIKAAVTLPPEDKPLMRHFYKKMNICEVVEPYVQHQVKLWWDKDKSITAKLLKVLYADCMVNGCDSSILLDGPNTEKTAAQNAGLGQDVFVLIDKIKTVVDIRCNNTSVVSCTDILNLAVRDAAHLAGAPSYPVFLGRRDGVQSDAAWVDLPSPSISWEQGFAYFKSKGLDLQDYATLLGSHTLGKTHCAYIHGRLYNFNKTGKPDPTMSQSLLDKLRQQCPASLKKGQPDPTVFLTDKYGPQYKFTNAYYANVLSYDSVLGVDQQLLFNHNMTQFVLEYAGSFQQYKKGFALSVSRMGGLKVLTGKQGEVRKNCRIRNN